MLATALKYGANASVSALGFQKAANLFIDGQAQKRNDVLFLSIGGARVYGDRTAIGALALPCLVLSCLRFWAEGSRACAISGLISGSLVVRCRDARYCASVFKLWVRWTENV
eukprot:1306902-Rhodomonas_salina.1